jgi:hypothetical protein
VQGKLNVLVQNPRAWFGVGLVAGKSRDLMRADAGE